MSDIQSLIKMLQSDNPNKRYDACEELRVSPHPLPLEATEALNVAMNDANANVADAAWRALSLHIRMDNEKEQKQELDKTMTNKEPSLAKRSRNLGIVAMAMMIGLTISNFTLDIRYTPDWVDGGFIVALLAALLLSIIGFVMGIYALREKNDRLTAILGLILNGIAFLPLSFGALFLVVSKG
jgi:hypothetical protein